MSQVLDTLDEEALIQRSRRGGVERVDVVALLRRWAESYDVFASNATRSFLAATGAADAFAELADCDLRVAVTGSFAAVRFAPIGRPSLLAVYADNVDVLARDLDLMEADEGANVAVLRPYDPVVWTRAAVADHINYVAPSQAVVDCLTGNGRMPAEGDALLEWMLAHEPDWRANSL